MRLDALIGTWLDAVQAQAAAMPGIKRAGSAADQGQKWRLEVEKITHAGGRFQLTCRSGFDHRGLRSSSGLTDGKVDLTLYRATGTWSAVQDDCTTLEVTAAQTTRISGSVPIGLLPLPGPSQSSDGVDEHTTTLEAGFVVVLRRGEQGGLILHSAELNAAAPLLLVRGQ